ncbi:Intracellular protease 1 [Candidatus Burarchaeum australiense]|nr:Intracellular protease 1 [Candidatus Burarchaeum australiense]
MAKVLMVVAPVDFRDEEAFGPREVLEAAGHRVLVASKGTRTAKGNMGGSLAVDVELADAKAGDYDAIIFIGGSGASCYFEDAEAHRLAREAAAAGKILGAICIAPITLAKAGMLEGKRATVWDNEGKQIGSIEKRGAKFSGEHVTVDGKLVTADGPAAAREFGKRIVELLA